MTLTDIAEHPSLDRKLHSTGNDSCNNLTPEHRARRDLHVVAKLEVRSELECLHHSDVSPGLEHHHGDRPSGEGIPNDQLCDHASQRVSG